MPIKNLIINGCSFSDDRLTPTWASFLRQQFPDLNYHNLAAGGAGNEYICRSTMNFLAGQNLDPKETLVLIMWSGTGRKDLHITGEWWYHLQESYCCGRNHGDQQYYVFSGGIANSWTKNKLTRKIFDWPYKLSDPTTLCQDSLLNFVNLENYLKLNDYNYQFTSYVNFWHAEKESNHLSGDYCIGYFCKDYAIYKDYKFTNWFFVNEQKDCLSEFVDAINEFDETRHPSTQGHNLFYDQVVLPRIKKFLV